MKPSFFSMALLAANVVVAQEFPTWMTPETRKAIAWRTPASDTIDIDWARNNSDTLLSRTGRLDSLVWLNIRLHPLLSVAMWPIEKVASPLGRYILRPLEMPTIYADEEDVTGRVVRLVQIDSAGKIMLYPTMVMDGGTGSRLGGTYINQTLLGVGSYTRLGGAYMINRDWYASTTISLPGKGPLYMHPNLRFSGGHSGNQLIWVPGNAPIGSGQSANTVREERQNAEVGLSSSLKDYGGAELLLRVGRKEIGPPEQKQAMFRDLSDFSWFDHGDRGVAGGEETWLSPGIVWGKGMVNLEGTPSEGGRQSVALFRTFDRGGGDAVFLNADMARYFLIGDERYAYRKGDLDPYLKLSPESIMSLLDPTTLKRRLTQRRILAVYLTVRRMWEVEPTRDPVSYFHFPALGGDAPARAYTGRRLMDHAVAGGSLEYRWPIWRYIDGAFFTEVAWAGDEWWSVNNTGFAPGWGLGLRVRTPRQFLFRGQFAYGLEGASVLVTVSPEF